MMKKVRTTGLLCLAMLFAFAPAALALDPIGPPTATLKKGQFSASVEYITTNMDLEEKSHSWSDNVKDQFNVDTDKVYAKFAYGISDDAEFFIRLGSTIDFEADQPGTDNKWQNNGDDEFTYGAGFRGTLFQTGPVNWGVLAQFSYVDMSGDRKAQNPDGWVYRDYYKNLNAEFDLKMLEAQVAFGPSMKFADMVTLYGGPFVYYINGTHDMDTSYTYFTETYTRDYNDSASRSVDHDPEVGVFVGAQANFLENAFLGVEYQYADDSDAFSAEVGWKF